MAAACTLGRSPWKMLFIEEIDVVNPTTPAIREKIMKCPVAMFPIGKYIGNILAGTDKTDAADTNCPTQYCKLETKILIIKF